eukprot:COSAG01_NODE_53705_length_337_cov_0.865546_1_plen_54_part_10
MSRFLVSWWKLFYPLHARGRAAFTIAGLLHLLPNWASYFIADGSAADYDGESYL